MYLYSLMVFSPPPFFTTKTSSLFFSGYYSWRNTISGPWFIQSLCQVFSRATGEEDIMDLLTKVNMVLNSSFQSNCPSKFGESVPRKRYEWELKPSQHWWISVISSQHRRLHVAFHLYIFIKGIHIYNKDLMETSYMSLALWKY